MKPAIAIIVLCFVFTVNGLRKAPDGKYPYQVSLWHIKQNIMTLQCAGSIINKRWILTAASCVDRSYNQTDPIQVHVTLNKFNRPLYVYEAVHIIQHEKYNGFNNNIALIRVNRDIHFNQEVQPVKFPSRDFTKVDYPATVSGYGLLPNLGSLRLPYHLEHEMKVVSQEECNRVLKNENSKDRICTMSNTGEEFCHGFKGGALVADDVQIGIISFYDVCFKGYSKSYTKVFNYLDWINQRINDF